MITTFGFKVFEDSLKKYVNALLSQIQNFGILNDSEIIKFFGEENSPGTIKPFEPTLNRKGLSFGLSSFGYDLKLNPDSFFIFSPSEEKIIDPKAMSKSDLQKVNPVTDDTGTYFVVPANTYALGVVEEFILMPKNVTAICVGKSTYARAGIIANMTPVEAGWFGHLTIEISNASSIPCKVYANEGIVQVLFFKGRFPSSTYDNRKYQNQPKEVVVSRVM